MISQQKVAIVIAMYNEERIARQCIEAVFHAIEQIPFPISVIIVNDGSTDGTAAILEKVRDDYSKKLTVITHNKNKGFGVGNESGMKKALSLGFDWVLHMDAGLTNDPKYISSFVSFCDKKYDCIKASRYMKGSKVLGVPLYRRFFSILGNNIARRLFRVGIRDCTNGFRMIRLSKLKGVHFKETSYAMLLEEFYYLKKRKATFYEIPYTLKMNKKTVSHFYYNPVLFFRYFKYAFKSFFVF